MNVGINGGTPAKQARRKAHVNRSVTPSAGADNGFDFTIHVSQDFQMPNAKTAMENAAQIAVSMVQSIGVLGPAMASFKGSTSPQLARAIQATENAWKGIESEFGMLSSMEVARLIGSSKSSRSLASDQRSAGKLIGVKRGNAYSYPGFQFDRRTSKILPVIPDLIQLAKKVEWDEEDLVLWLCTPTGYFDGDRPVDHLGDGDLVDIAWQSATVEW